METSTYWVANLDNTYSRRSRCRSRSSSGRIRSKGRNRSSRSSRISSSSSSSIGSTVVAVVAVVVAVVVVAVVAVVAVAAVVVVDLFFSSKHYTR